MKTLFMNAAWSSSLLPLAIIVGVWAIRWLRSWLQRKACIKQYQCKPPAKFPQKGYFLGLDMLFLYRRAIKQGNLLATQRRHFLLHGKTFAVNMFGTTTIKTMDPDIMKAVLATSFERFGLQPLRHKTARNLFGDGIVVMDGPGWARARSLIRSSFEKAHVTSMATLRKHVDRFKDLLPRDESTIDMLPLLKRLVGPV